MKFLPENEIGVSSSIIVEKHLQPSLFRLWIVHTKKTMDKYKNTSDRISLTKVKK